VRTHTRTAPMMHKLVTDDGYRAIVGGSGGWWLPCALPIISSPVLYFSSCGGFNIIQLTVGTGESLTSVPVDTVYTVGLLYRKVLSPPSSLSVENGTEYLYNS